MPLTTVLNVNTYSRSHLTLSLGHGMWTVDFGIEIGYLPRYCNIKKPTELL